MLSFEKDLYSDEIILIAGCDEAGRGPLCGPVVAAACILKNDFNDELINDSKKLSEKNRLQAYKIVLENAIDFGIGVINPTEIDEINIYNASRKAMLIALSNMKTIPHLILTDYMPLDYKNIKVISIAHGDALSKNIAAASIIAKVTRDKMMDEFDKIYPQYDLKNNKGYGTKKHLEALDKYGPIKGFHRFSYRPVFESYNKDLKLKI